MLPVFASLFDVHPFDLVRVDVPDHPEAIASSETGSLLLAPPEAGTPWRPESVPHTDAWTATEALEAMNVGPWHDAGIKGAGVKIAVFDPEWFGAEADSIELGEVTTHDCFVHRSCTPPIDTWRPSFGFESGVHGFACAEIIRDIAPEADLHLVRVSGETTLENAVDWAIREDIDVVSMSLSYFNSSFYDGTGQISAHMDRLIAAGILMVTSSGNYAEGHWSGSWRDVDRDGRMDFDGQNGLWVYMREGKSRGVYVLWNQFSGCGATDLSATMYDPDGAVVGHSDARQVADADSCQPAERLKGYVEETGWFWLEVELVAGAVGDLRLDLLTTVGEFAEAMPSGSIVDPGVHPGVLTVGAVRADGYVLNSPEPFSSMGPTYTGVAKPDLAGPDGLSTSAYGANGFYGTSASTPAVAGLVALVQSSDPDLTSVTAAARIKGWALSGDGDIWRGDPRWGDGKARLPAEPVANSPCGRRPLLMSLFLVPFWRRRRRHWATWRTGVA